MQLSINLVNSQLDVVEGQPCFWTIDLTQERILLEHQSKHWNYCKDQKKTSLNHQKIYSDLIHAHFQNQFKVLNTKSLFDIHSNVFFI